MNILGLVFSIMLILSYGYYAIWDKHVAIHKLRSSYTDHSVAAREILNQLASDFYNGLSEAKKENSLENRNGKKGDEEKDEGEPKEEELKLNRECARLNLWPLIQEGREAHPALYDLMAKLIRTFYAPLSDGKRFEYRFLDLLLLSAKKAKLETLPLEKLQLNDPAMQKVYYKMLRGTKKWDLKEKKGFPPLLDYVKAERSEEKICVFHAHPDMLTVLFNSKIGWELYREIHKKGGSLLSKELIEKIALEMHVIRVDPEILDLLALSGYLGHEERKKTFVASEGEVTLRKNLFLK